MYKRQLLQLLTAAPNQSVSIARACSALGVQTSDLDRIVEIVSSLSDRSTGVRAIIDMDEKTISLGGDAARLVPLRLSINDAAVLRYVLASLNIDQSTRLRIQAALDDPSQLQTQMISLAEPARYGSFYQKLLEAIEDGAVSYTHLDVYKRQRQQRLTEAGEGRVYTYSLDMRNTSNTWVDECTVTDPLDCVAQGMAKVTGVITPVAQGDFDGKLNVCLLYTSRCV